MKYPVLLIPAIVAIGALAAAVFSYGQSSQARQELDDLRAQYENVESADPEPLLEPIGNMEQLTAERDRLEDEVIRLRTENEELTLALRESLAEIDPEDAGSEEEESNPCAAQIKEMMQDESMVEMQASMAVEMTYKYLFASLELPFDVEAQVRDFLVAASKEEFALNLGALTGGAKLDFEERQRLEDATLETLCQNVATVLNQEEFDEFDDYLDHREEYQMRGSRDMSLGMLAGGLTPENREVVLDVMLEKTMLATEERDGGQDTEPNTAAMIEAQMQSIERARDRLEDFLDEEQFAHFSRYVDMTISMSSQSVAMMEAFMPAEEPEEVVVEEPEEATDDEP